MICVGGPYKGSALNAFFSISKLCVAMAMLNNRD